MSEPATSHSAVRRHIGGVVEASAPATAQFPRNGQQTAWGAVQGKCAGNLPVNRKKPFRVPRWFFSVRALPMRLPCTAPAPRVARSVGIALSRVPCRVPTTEILRAIACAVAGSLVPPKRFGLFACRPCRRDSSGYSIRINFT